MAKRRKLKEGYVEESEPAFGERLAGPELAIKIRRMLQTENERLTPLPECYERVRERIFAEGLELKVIALVRSDFYLEALTTSPAELFARLGARRLLSGFWKPPAPRRRLRR